MPSSKGLAVGRAGKSKGKERWEKAVLLGRHKDRTLACDHVPGVCPASREIPVSTLCI